MCKHCILNWRKSPITNHIFELVYALAEVLCGLFVLCTLGIFNYNHHGKKITSGDIILDIMDYCMNLQRECEYCKKVEEYEN
jgi:hypothetical protein